MRNHARGYQVITDPGASWMSRTVECDLTECAHCNRVVYVGPRVDTCYCTCCDKIICESCEAKGGCDPIEEKLRRMEAHSEFLLALGA